MTIDLRKLRYFVAVSEEKNLVRAARRLNLAQPALSRRMRDLELDLGVQLFERQPRGVALTPEGHLLAERAPLILAQVSSLPAQLARADKLAGGRVRIAHPHLARSWSLRLAGLLQAIRGRFPTLILEARLLSSFEQPAALHDDVIDFGVCFGPLRHANGVASLRVFEETVCAARLGRAHPAAQKSELSVSADLAREPLIIFPRERNPRLYDRMIRMARRSGHQGSVLAPVDHAADAWRRGVISDEQGWALVQRSEIDNNDEWTVCRPLVDVELPITMELCWLAATPCRHIQQVAAVMPELAGQVRGLKL